jgi:restriction endonuclease S subunit
MATLGKLDPISTNPTGNHTTIMASITQFSSTIDKIRNILRLHTPSIVNEQSSNHICLYILARCLTLKKCTELKIPLDFAWENIVKQFRNVEGGKQRGYDLFYSPTEECFIKHVDTLFGTSSEDYPFKVRELEKHKQIIELIDKIDMDSIDLGVDAFGFVYEDELSHSKGARKNGEHFTDRKICDYMTKLVNPRVNADGVPESVCDPSMGTGGFLFTYQKFFKDTKIDVNWNIHKHRIYGQDVINSSVCKAKMNLYVNTNMVCENLVLRNSLTNDLQNTSFDIILANMPFGLKGLKHADCCERVKGLKIRGTKSEPLFLQLMMVSLAPGGRCAVVVPDGMLTHTTTLHDQTRKYLLDHFELKRVIKMKGQFFMNTSIQPSILFFENTGKPTTALEFWEVARDEKGEITESMIVSVPRTKIDASCSFDMRRYLESDKPDANPAGFPLVKLGDILVGVKGATLTLEKATPGSFPLYSASVDIRSHLEPGFDDQESIIQACVGSNLVNCIHYVNRPFAATGNLWVLRRKESADVAVKFVYYWLLLTKTVLKKVNVSVLPKINKKDFDEIIMPLPPLSIQEEIVATLDIIYNTSASAKEMIPRVKAQMAAVVKASMTGVESKKYVLSDLATDNPESLTKADKFDTINYVDLGSVKEGVISSVQSIAFAEKPSRAQRKIKDGDIIWGGVRPLSKSYAYVGTAIENMIGSSGFIVVRNKDTAKVLSKYLYYAITTDECVSYLNSHSTGTSYPAFNSATIMAYEVNIPSIAVQTRTLERLSLLESQLTALESLQKQTDDNARFILESYLTSASDSEELENTITHA